MKVIDASTSPFKNSSSGRATTVRNHSQLAVTKQQLEKSLKNNNNVNSLVALHGGTFDSRVSHETEESDTILVGIQSLG